MDPFELIRERATQLHEELVRKGANPSNPLELVKAAVHHLDFGLSFVASTDPVLKGARALFDEQSGMICCVNESDADKVCLVAHEIGHACVHASTSECRSGDIDPSRSIEMAPIGLQRVEDYGARERRELQADVFAREFLLPRRSAREHYLVNPNADVLASTLGLPASLVYQQLYDALLLPSIQYEEAAAKQSRDNPSQERAANHRGTPHLLEAGPGTGKTSTLIRRVLSLLKDDVDPASILVLTFSNRAAGELSERLIAAVPDAAPKIWIGTFHAFGLDIVRRYHDKLKLPPDPPLFDRSDAIEVLEEILPALPLVHYRNLWDPAMELREIINAISRAKDELVDAEGYHALAAKAREAAIADNEDEVEEANKALEVASVYKLYERALRERAAVDFGDLIMLPTLLIERDPDVAAVLQLRHRHILVDEYQDVNRASARLVKALSGEGSRLWVVGDARQSIYRFRGASSANMARFKDDYPNSKVDQLEVNYRSSEEIVKAFQAIAPHMKASQGMMALDLHAECGRFGVQPQLRTVNSPDDEIGAIAFSIRELEAGGVPLRDQAVLCRTNSRLSDIATGLEARGIPVLHLGSLFEREEIRDLLALLSLSVDPTAAGLVRVGAMSRYDIPLQDAYVAIARLQQTDGVASRKLPTILDDPNLSAEGRQGLDLLCSDLNETTREASPWQFLSKYLLNQSGYVADLARRDDVRSRMQGVAIWQFLNFVRDQASIGTGHPIQKLLNRVRTLVLLAEERDLRQIPPSALHMKAVKLMTVHGSKGLEFEAVHLPGLVSTGFPASFRGQRCPPPRGLIAGSETVAGGEFARESHDAEEECLFFVAVSRAKQHLRLYNYRKQANGANRGPSGYLDWLRPANLAEQTAAPVTPLPPDAPRFQPITIGWRGGWKITHSMATSYRKCGRRFFYTHVMGLRGAKKTAPFNQTHDCLYDFIDWLAEARIKGDLNRAIALAELEKIWAARGPTEHAFATDYHNLATRIAESLLTSMEGREFHPVEELPIPLAGGNIVVVPDGLTASPEGTPILRRIRTGKKRSKEYEDDYVYGLYHLAAQTRYGKVYIIEVLHLSDNLLENAPVPTTKVMANRRKAGEDLVAGISSGMFAPDPDAVSCPRCPHFFICASAGRGPLTQI
jgi:DNA helicase II / ATP-dependent DNA helicase PcrA